MMQLRKRGTSITAISIAITLPIAVILYFILFRPLIAPTVYEWATTVLLKSTSEQICNKATFERYKVPDVYMGPVAPFNAGVDPIAREFKTAIQKGMNAGTNFAGHYAVTRWKCGTHCRQYAIVDIRTGNLVTIESEPYGTLEYYATSSLLIVKPIPYSEDNDKNKSQDLQTEFYTLKNDTLTLLCKKATKE